MSVSEKIDQLVGQVKFLIEQHNLPYYKVLKHEDLNEKFPDVKIGIILDDQVTKDKFYQLKLNDKVYELKYKSKLPDKLRKTPYLTFQIYTLEKWKSLVNLQELMNHIVQKMKKNNIHFSKKKMSLSNDRPIIKINIKKQNQLEEVCNPSFYTEIWMLARNAKLTSEQYEKLEIIIERVNYIVYKEPNPFVPPEEDIRFYPSREEVTKGGKSIIEHD